MKLTSKEVALQLIENLWIDYSSKVSYASDYARLLNRKGGNIVVDHLVFRTLNTHCGEQPGGIEAITHLFQNFGYHISERFESIDKMITVQSLFPADSALPKILAGQLEVNHLPGKLQHHIAELVKETPYLISDKGIALMNTLSSNGELPIEAARFLIADLKGYFCRPWQIPSVSVIDEIIEYSPYCAWVLLFGNNVYRVSASVNFQKAKDWSDLQSTIASLKSDKIPFGHILSLNEGILQMAFTKSVKINAEVLGTDGIVLRFFDYSSFGLTERAMINANDEKQIFDGFDFGSGSHFSEII